MDIEYEATFPEVDKDKVRVKLKELRAKLIKPEFLQKRCAFHLPKSNEIKKGWLRVRDEGDKITMSLKVMEDESKIEGQKEICIVVNNFDEAVKLLESIGCKKKAYQESKREVWMINNVEVTIDEWPFLEPFVEVEGKSEEDVEKVADILGFDYSKAVFSSVDVLYSRKYGVSEEVICDHTPRIVFGEENPFLDK